MASARWHPGQPGDPRHAGYEKFKRIAKSWGYDDDMIAEKDAELGKLGVNVSQELVFAHQLSKGEPSGGHG